jgi:spore germination cell wall hydrolase CwlJ-like protein
MRRTNDQEAVAGVQPGEMAEQGPVCPQAQSRRLLQLHSDARAEFLEAEDDLKTVRRKLNAIAAGIRDPEHEPEPPVEPAFIGPPAAASRLQPRRWMAAVTAFGVVAMAAGGIVYARIAMPELAAPPGVTEDRPLALLPPAGQDGAQTSTIAGTTDGADLGRTLYAAQFSKAPAAERACLARAIYYEARGEDTGGQMAVAQVILNRVRAHKWPETICGVIQQGAEGEKCQFSFICNSRLTEPHGEIWIEAQLIAEQALAGQAWLRELADATHYHTKAVAPVWRLGLTEVATIGSHVFYREPDGLRPRERDQSAYIAAVAAETARQKAGAAAKAARARAATASAQPAAKAAVSEPGWAAKVFQP